MTEQNKISKNDLVYKIVMDRIISELEKGTIPWQKPWTANSSNAAYNRVTKRPYSLLNQFLLGKAGEWATMKQWNEAGGKVKKGSKASVNVFWKMHKKVAVNPETGEKEEKVFAILKYNNVFHISQVEGVEPIKQDEVVPYENEMIDDVEMMIEAYERGANLRVVREPSDQAYYRSDLDEIVVPELNQFKNSNEFYSTLLHELTHSTGHKSRLNRNIQNRFGSKKYSFEELVAEMGSAYLCNICNIETDDTFKNSAAYCQSWLKSLNKNTVEMGKAFVKACSMAEKAAKYILGFSADKPKIEKPDYENLPEVDLAKPFKEILALKPKEFDPEDFQFDTKVNYPLMVPYAAM